MFAGALTTPTGGNSKNGSAACAPRWEWIQVQGNVNISGTLVLGGIVMNTHTHAGVHGKTGGPQ